MYGWVLDAAWLLVDAGHGLYAETWRALSSTADFVAGNWMQPDAGIWEMRDEPRHYVHSKLMAWMALDRALRIAGRRTTPRRRVRRWEQARAALACQVISEGYDDEGGRFLRSYASSETDAALLILPVLGFEPRRSPRLLGTIDAVRRQLSAGDDLIYRYAPGNDGLDGVEGAFLPCSFWLVQALAYVGRVDEAGATFERLVSRGGSLGLFAEEVDPGSGAFLGNYPQALTHSSLIQAALAVRDATSGEAGDRERPRTADAQPV